MKASDLRVGDIIVNPIGAHGQVTRIANGVVEATFRYQGGSARERWDEAWFARYGWLTNKLRKIK